MAKPLYFALCLSLTTPYFALAQASDPDSARIVVEDIGRFWRAFDRAALLLRPRPLSSII